MTHLHNYNVKVKFTFKLYLQNIEPYMINGWLISIIINIMHMFTIVNICGTKEFLYL